MNFLAGLLLLFMSEEECYWIFHVISDILIPEYYTMDGVIVDSNGTSPKRPLLPLGTIFIGTVSVHAAIGGKNA